MTHRWRVAMGTLFVLGVSALGTGISATPLDLAIPWGTDEKDPLIVQGDYVAPAREGAPVLIALHGLGSDRSEWRSLAAAAQKRGWGVYLYDARGHGKSRATLTGKEVNHEDRAQRRPAFWFGMMDDLARAAQAVEGRGVPPARQVWVGASLGANVCLLTASRGLPPGALVLMSPGLDYAGLEVDEIPARVAAPMMFVSAQPDTYAHISAERLLGQAEPGRSKWIALEKGTARGAHGAQLFDGKLEEKILDWVGRAMKLPQPRSTGASPNPKR
jgi:pimeloyl-ACP methyl ester carboxylesterase